MKRVFCVLADGVEETELVAPVDLLRRAGVEVVMVSTTGTPAVTGKHGIVLQADALLEDVSSEDFDALFLPGGPAVMSLRSDGRVLDLIRSFGADGKPLAAICAAPLLLSDAGLLEGRRFTAHFTTREELPGALPDEAVVLDGPVLTSRGAGTALAFGLAFVELLAGAEAAAAVGDAIMI